MKKFIALLTLVAGFLISPVLGQENCPKINIHGPVGIVPPGGIVTYRATIEPIEKNWQLKYEWSISSGKIEAGQGTPTVLIRQGETTLTVTVDILGLPDRCPSTFTETSFGDPAPSAVKVGTWKKGQAPTIHQQFAGELTQHPDNQGFVFIIRGPTSTKSSLAELTAIIRNVAKDQVLDTTRVTIVEAEGFEELAEFWRVPPGADNPKCESCKVAECPTITVTGPPGVWMPGEQITFSARISPIQTISLSYKWTIEGGSITGGQGTPEVTVRTQKGDHTLITATLDIGGLPKGCPITFSETSGIVVHYTAILLDEHSIPIGQINRAKLDRLAKRLAEKPSHQGYIIEYFPPNTSRASIDHKIKLIRDYMISRGYSEHEYKAVVAEAPRPLTRIYLVPPGTEFPTP